MRLSQLCASSYILRVFFSLWFTASVHSASINPTCGSWNTTTVICLNKYASVLPGNFSRQVSTNAAAEDTFDSTLVPADQSFSRITNATFLVFDATRAVEILGNAPSLQLMFTTPKISHEGPVYVPEQNHLYVTQVSQDALAQILIDLNKSPPTLEYFLADPPLYAPAGSQYHNGLIYYSSTGTNVTTSGDVYRPGIYTFDPKTNKTETLLNNYFGYFFNGADDIALEANGDIWFTDDAYGWLDKTATTPPALPSATYRFRPSTGAVQIVNTGLVQPNGIRFSPSGQTLYLSDTGAASGPLSGPFDQIHYTWSSRGPRTLYAFDVVPSSGSSSTSTSDRGNATNTIVNGRPIYLSQDWVPDGLQVARNGMLVTATGNGLDILDETGLLLVRIQLPFRAVSMAFAGDDLRDLWIVGVGKIALVQWALQGQELV